jgi:hypothetical protein
MKKLLMAALLTAVLMVGVSGCKSHSGSREYTPGQGWQQN